jgi:hypothetical protein
MLDLVLILPFQLLGPVFQRLPVYKSLCSENVAMLFADRAAPPFSGLFVIFFSFPVAFCMHKQLQQNAQLL